MTPFRPLWILPLLLLCLLSARPAHPFYLSVSEIYHNPTTHQFEISIRVFTEDLEKAIQAQGEGFLMLGTEQEAPRADALLMAYVSRQVSLQVQGQPVTLRWVGKEIEPESSWLYLESVPVQQVAACRIENRLFTELFEAQQNIVHTHINGHKKSIILDRTKPAEEIRF
ncbi:MAG: DUF6702 family protein [Bacteroidia bacterium]|nr:DUF6702 family protein [Bacteroidia bacterium]